MNLEVGKDGSTTEEGAHSDGTGLHGSGRVAGSRASSRAGLGGDGLDSRVGTAGDGGNGGGDGITVGASGGRELRVEGRERVAGLGGDGSDSRVGAGGDALDLGADGGADGGSSGALGEGRGDAAREGRSSRGGRLAERGLGLCHQGG